MKNNPTHFKENTSNFLLWLLGLALVLPVIILPPNFQPSDWTRSMLFRIIITILISFLLYRFFYKQNIFISLPKWNTSNYLPFLFLVGFFIILIVATIFSQDITFSIFGSPTRSGGVLNLLFFFIFSIILALFINKNQWEKLFTILFITGSIASLLAIVQYFNLLKNVFISHEGGSTPSFLGNSTILAIYMLFLSFLSFVLFVQKQTKKEKIAYGILFLLFIFTIFITGSRAGYLGLLAGFLYFFLWYPYPKKFKILKITASLILLSSIVAIVFFNFFPQIGEKNNTLKIITDRVSIQKIARDITGTRLSVWKITLQEIQDKPLLGWGPENFYIGFEKYYDPIPFDTPILLWDRPHNILLDIAVSSGILSLLLYIGFWGTLFWKLQTVKNAQKKDDYYADNTIKIHGVQAAFIGYSIVLFFNFDNFSTYIISFFFIGCAFYLIWLGKEAITIFPPKKTFLQKKPLILIYIAVAIVFLWFWNIKPLYLNEKIAHAKNLAMVRYCKEAFSIANNENWAHAGILKSHAILLYSDIMRNCAFIEPEKEVEYSKKMMFLLSIAAKTRPTFSRTWLFMGSFTNVLAAREENIEKKNNLLLETNGYLQKALTLSPQRQEIFSEMGKSYLIAQDYVSMKKMGQDCIKIDPRFNECYWYLGVAQIFLNEQEEGKKNIALALQYGYNYNPGYKQLAVAYMSQKNWADAVLAYEKVLIPDETFAIPAAASHYATLAFLYEKAGDYTKAGQTALKVFRLQPENPETLQFIKLLLGKKPNDPILNSSLAFIYAQPGPEQELSKAKAIYLVLSSRYPENTDYLWEIMNIEYQLKEYEGAYQTALRRIFINPKLREGMEEFIKKIPGGYWKRYVENEK